MKLVLIDLEHVITLRKRPSDTVFSGTPRLLPSL